MANYVSQEDFASLWATLKDKDAEIDKLNLALARACKDEARNQRIISALKTLLSEVESFVDYQESGAPDWSEWDKKTQQLVDRLSCVKYALKDNHFG